MNVKKMFRALRFGIAAAVVVEVALAVEDACKCYDGEGDASCVPFIVREVGEGSAFSSNFANDLASERLPVIVKRPLPPGWKLWTPENITRSFGDVDIDVERSSDYNFAYFDIDNPNLFEMSDMHAIEQDHVKMKLADLVDVVQGSNDGVFYYFTRPMRMGNMRPLRPYFDPSPLQVTSEEFETCHPPEINFWMGGPNVVRTSTHYDSLHNFFVQLHGQKTFTLHPPCAADALKVFPHLHPQSRKSKVALREPDVSFFPFAVRVTVHAGETLYIPPYWFHAVEKHDSGASISVNVFTASVEADVYNSVTTFPLPFEESWMEDARVRIVAAKKWLRAVARWSGLDPSIVAQSLVRSRYDDAGLPSASIDPSDCTDNTGILPPDLEERFNLRALELVSTHFARLHDRSLLGIMIKDYFEIVAYNIIEKERIRGFFASCMSS